jgi:hypothetical protein
MRLLPFALLLLSTVAYAQAPAPRVSIAEGTLIAAGATAGTFVGTVALLSTLELANVEGLAVLLPAALVTSSASVYGLGALLGNDGRLAAAVGGAAIGLLPSAGYLIAAARLGETTDPFAYHVAAFMAGTVLPPLTATLGYSLVPAAHRTPTGETLPGAALLVRF